VRDNPERARFEIEIDGRVVGFIDYRRAGDVLALTHAEVEPACEGRGIGSRLARGVLEDARKNGFKVRPICPFVAEYVRRNPEFAPLVAR